MAWVYEFTVSNVSLCSSPYWLIRRGYTHKKIETAKAFTIPVSTNDKIYRIISEKGIDRPGAWIFGGLALGFYTGNIYGSVKSAKVYNEFEEKKYEDRVQYLLDIYYGR